MTNKFTAIILFSVLTSSLSAQTDSLQQRIEQIIKTKNADIGVAVYGLESKDSMSIHNSLHFPMQSVFKFHIALAVLNKADKGILSLTQKIFIQKKDLLPNTWSPIRKKYPDGNIYLSLADILAYTVSESDNNGCDILLRLIGGPKKVNDYIHTTGIKDLAINATEEEMHKEWNVQFTNWTTPAAATGLLKTFYDRKDISKKSFDFLWKILSETSSGNNRIKKQLPAGTLVAHKTGTSDTNEQGITAAVNDIGIVTLPNGEHFAISVFVSNSKENNETNEKIISDISKITWDYFVNRIK